MTNKIAQEFQIDEAVIFADRFDEEYDIKSYVSEISFFEDLDKSYLTGQLVFMDDISVVETIGIKGTEQIRFSISTTEKQTVDASFTITMNIVSIVRFSKVNERNSVYHFDLISPHAYRDANLKISRSYTGSLDDISQRILNNHLNVKVDRSYMGGTSPMQSEVKVITPYISPLECVDWLMDRATTDIGAPFWCWQTLYDQREDEEFVRFGNLEYMMNVPAFNERVHLLYSESRGQSVALGNISKQGVTIKNLEVENVEDTLKLIYEGAIGSRVVVQDTYTSQTINKHFGITNLIDKLESKNVFSGGDQNIFDESQELTIENKTRNTNEFDSIWFRGINSYGTYGSVNSYHDTPDPSDALNKLRSNSIRSLLNRNMINITIPGITFFAAKEKGVSGVGAGDIVWVDFLTSDVDDTSSGNLDEEKSGLYLIYRCRNIFRNTAHEVVASITKLAKNPTQL